MFRRLVPADGSKEDVLRHEGRQRQRPKHRPQQQKLHHRRHQSQLHRVVHVKKKSFRCRQCGKNRESFGRSSADCGTTHDLQRSRHECGDGTSENPPRQVCEEVRDQARLHVFLHQSHSGRPQAGSANHAEIRDNSIVYRHYADIGVAVGGGKGRRPGYSQRGASIVCGY